MSTILLGTTWLGTVPGWLTLFALAVVGYYVVRGGAGSALSVLETANRVLMDRVTALEIALRASEAKVADLQARTDLEPLLASIAGEFAQHERRANERHEAQLALTRELVMVSQTHSRALERAVARGE